MISGPQKIDDWQPDRIELTVTRLDTGPYYIQLRYQTAQSDTQAPLVAVPVTFPPELFGRRAAFLTNKEYGERLGRAVFAHPDINNTMQQALGALRERNAGYPGSAALRLRVFCTDDAIQSLHWETILLNGEPVFGAGVALSRYISPTRPGPRPRGKSSLRALIFIASPGGVENEDDADSLPDTTPGKLARIDVGKELAIAEKALRSDKAGSGIAIQTEFLGSPGNGTLEALRLKLDEGDGYDILYLVCHGSLDQTTGACLFLESKPGSDSPIEMRRAGDLVKGLGKPPRLVVLASCQSAGTGNIVANGRIPAWSLAALGPQLARAGVPAVIAMQGKVLIATAEHFVRGFFSSLREDGQVDRALAAARANMQVLCPDDYWMPVLFSSSPSGTLFEPYRPGFEDNEDTPWATLVTHIREGKKPEPDFKCIPILGPDCLEPLWGSMREIASWLAQSNNFPLEEHLSESFPAVAQYIENKFDLHTLLAAAESRDASGVITQSGLIGYLQSAWKQPLATPVWDRLAERAAARRSQAVPGHEDIHALLAALPFRLYLTASPDTILEQALTEAGREPRSDFARWNSDLCDRATYGKTDGFQPTWETPFVYHLFGSAKYEESLVLTEDDFADYMLGINTEESLNFTPSFINAALAHAALLFVGFHFKDDAFRVVLRNTLRRVDRNPGKKKKTSAWVGAQIPPERDRYRRVDAARKYIADTLDDVKLKLLWGTAQDFIDQLGVKVRAEPDLLIKKP